MIQKPFRLPSKRTQEYSLNGKLKDNQFAIGGRRVMVIECAGQALAWAQLVAELLKSIALKIACLKQDNHSSYCPGKYGLVEGTVCGLCLHQAIWLHSFGR